MVSIFFIFTLAWGNDLIWRTYFLNGLVQPPTICFLSFKVVFHWTMIIWLALGNAGSFIIITTMKSFIPSFPILKAQLWEKRWFSGNTLVLRVFERQLLLMDKILHHLGCMKPCKEWENHHPWWLAWFCPSTAILWSTTNIIKLKGFASFAPLRSWTGSFAIGWRSGEAGWFFSPQKSVGKKNGTGSRAGIRCMFRS